MLNDVSLLGLGRMGEPMARNLLVGLGSLTVWNRSPGKSDLLRHRGAVVAQTPAEAATAVTFTVVTDLADVEDLLAGPDGLLEGWKRTATPRPILVISGTVSPVDVAALGRRLAYEGIGVVDAPLSGGIAGADAGTLSIMVGGTHDDVDKVTPLLAHMGTTIRHLGPTGSGQFAKACNQIVVASTIAAISEAFVLGDAAHLDRADVLDLLSGGLASSEVLRQKGQRWIENAYEGGGSSANQLKDLRIITDAAHAHSLRLNVVDTVTERFATAVELDGEGALDHSAVVLSIARHSRTKPT